MLEWTCFPISEAPDSPERTVFVCPFFDELMVARGAIPATPRAMRRMVVGDVVVVVVVVEVVDLVLDLYVVLVDDRGATVGENVVLFLVVLLCVVVDLRGARVVLGTQVTGNACGQVRSFGEKHTFVLDASR